MATIMLLHFIFQALWHVTFTEVTMTTDGSWAQTSSFDYGIDIRGTDHIYFRLKCCNDAFMILQSSYTNPANSATLSMGIISNAKCNIQACSSCSKQSTTDYPFLSCNELRPFWVSWTNGNLKLGQGHLVGQHLMVAATQPMGFTVQYMSVSSGWSAIGVWEIRGNYQINPSPCNALGFHLHNVNSKVTKTAIHGSKKVTLLDCVLECRLLRRCRSVNYRYSDQVCNTFNTVPLAGELTINSEWHLLISD